MPGNTLWIPQICQCCSCIAGMVLDMDTGWYTKHFPKPFPIKRPQRLGDTIELKFAYSLSVSKSRRGQWHGQNPFVPAGIRGQCQTWWATVTDVATASTWSERVIFITVLLCRREMRWENGGLHSDSCQQCQDVSLWQCNYRSILCEKRSDVWISPLQLPQIPAFMQLRKKNLL